MNDLEKDYNKILDRVGAIPIDFFRVGITHSKYLASDMANLEEYRTKLLELNYKPKPLNKKADKFNNKIHASILRYHRRIITIIENNISNDNLGYLQNFLREIYMVRPLLIQRHSFGPYVIINRKAPEPLHLPTTTFDGERRLYAINVTSTRWEEIQLEDYVDIVYSHISESELTHNAANSFKDDKTPYEEEI